MAHWHGLAKLCLHTDATLDIMDNVTTALGQALCDFKVNTCSMFSTRELQKEVNARKCRQAKKSTKKNSPATQKSANMVIQNSSKIKEFNLNTYKFHALGDIANTI
jgi:hypothetical protein